MTNAQIVSRLKKEFNSEVKKYPGLARWERDKSSVDVSRCHIDVFNELLKYYKEEDLEIKNFGTCTLSSFLKGGESVGQDIFKKGLSQINLKFYPKHLNRDNSNNIFLEYSFYDINRKFPSINIYIKVDGKYSYTNFLNPEMLPEIIQVFKALDDKYDKLKEEITIEVAKTKKMSDMIDVTLVTLVKNKFKDRITNASGILRENTLFFTVAKSSRNKAIFKINVKKFNNDFNVILDAIEQFLKLTDIEWLKFEYKGL